MGPNYPMLSHRTTTRFLGSGTDLTVRPLDAEFTCLLRKSLSASGYGRATRDELGEGVWEGLRLRDEKKNLYQDKQMGVVSEKISVKERKQGNRPNNQCHQRNNRQPRGGPGRRPCRGYVAGLGEAYADALEGEHV